MSVRTKGATVTGTAEPPAGTQAIGRALGVLKVLGEQESELSAPRIADLVGLSSGTANRVIRALVASGLVAHNPRTDRYFLGTGAILLGQAAQHGFGLDKALPVLEQVGRDTKESVNLVVREGDESVVMLRVQSTLPLRFEQHAGARFPLYTTASGKAILAYSSDADAYLARLPKKLAPLTGKTLRNPADLAAQLGDIRKRGYSIDEQENVDGVRCVGAPVLDFDGRAQAALVIQVPAVRMSPQRRGELGKVAMTAAKEIAQFVPVDRIMTR